MRKEAGSSTDAPLIDKLLDNRRLFLEPIKSTPSLTTINGFGTRLYGRDQYNPADGTYIGTLCFCALYIPVFPLAQYLIRKVEGNRYQFFGKLPPQAILQAFP